MCAVKINLFEIFQSLKFSDLYGCNLHETQTSGNDFDYKMLIHCLYNFTFLEIRNKIISLYQQIFFMF